MFSAGEVSACSVMMDNSSPKYLTPLESKSYVLNFHQIIKSRLLGDTSIPSNILHYRRMLPSEFCTAVLFRSDIYDEYRFADILKKMAQELKRTSSHIYHPAFLRCEQLLVEYAVLLHGNHACLNEDTDAVRALASFYDEDYGEGMWTLEKTCRMDDNAFRTAVTLIQTRETHQHVLDSARRMIGWNTRVVPLSDDINRVYLDTEVLDMVTLLTVQRTHERIMMSRFPVDDISTYGAPWSGILRQRVGCPSHLREQKISRRAYKYSDLRSIFQNKGTYGDVCSKSTGIMIGGSYDGVTYHLFLHDGKRRSLQAARYEGLLEVLSAEDRRGRIFVDRRLEHQYVNKLQQSEKSVFLTDNSGVFRESVDAYSIQEQYMTRLNHLVKTSCAYTGRIKNFEAHDGQTETDTISDESKHGDFRQQPSMPQVNADDYERNQLLAQSYVEDILLWTYTQLNQHGITLDNVNALAFGYSSTCAAP